MTTQELSPEEAALKDLFRDKEFDLALAQDKLAAQSALLSEAKLKGDPDLLLAPAPTPTTTKPTITITALYERYVAEDRITASTISDWRASIKKFVAFLGHDDPGRVTSQDIMRWRNEMKAEPKSNGEPRSAQRVTAGYLAPVKAAFAYGLENFLIDENPAKSVAKVREPRKPVLRGKDFTKAEQRLILSAALLPPTRKLSEKRILARRWVPWLCAYTGARVNEITQLRGEDVTQIDGHWVIRITPEAGNVKTKTARVVPIHSDLIGQGFPRAIFCCFLFILELCPLPIGPLLAERG